MSSSWFVVEETEDCSPTFGVFLCHPSVIGNSLPRPVNPGYHFEEFPAPKELPDSKLWGEGMEAVRKDSEPYLPEASAFSSEFDTGLPVVSVF